MRSDAMGHQLLPKRIALPIFASDALSSVAYAPDEVLLTLALAGTMAALQSVWVGVVVALVLAVVVASYRQTVHAYPSGGGDYEVVTTNLGRSWGLLVASALLVDYILTVAVSISSGASYITTAVPALVGYEVPIAVALVVILATLNLRGTREAGGAFAVPTYVYMFSIGLMVVVGFAKLATGHLGSAPTAAYDLVAAPAHADGLAGLAGAFLLMRAFSSGCAALTGVEAISNGVPMFRRPKSRNAATTLAMLGRIAAAMMISILFLARATGVKIVDDACYPADPTTARPSRQTRRSTRRSRRSPPQCSVRDRSSSSSLPSSPASSWYSPETRRSTASRPWPRSCRATPSCRTRWCAAATASPTRTASSS